MSLQRTLTLLEYRLPPITVCFGRAVMPVEGNAFQVAAVDGASVLAWFLASSFYGGGQWHPPAFALPANEKTRQKAGFSGVTEILKAFSGTLSGSTTWTRTRDPVINSHLLYQLSYRGMAPMLLIQKEKSSV